MASCTIGGCGRDHYARGWCHMHYQRWAKHGDPEYTLPSTGGKAPPLVVRFWGRAQRQESGCLEFPPHQGHRYGSIYWEGTIWVASRLAWTLTNGSIPAGIEVCHHCDNPPCIEPTHLFLGTRRENDLDAVKKGRKPTGESHGRTTLTDEDVAYIRAHRRPRDGEQLREWVDRFGVHKSTIHNIVSGRTWIASARAAEYGA